MNREKTTILDLNPITQIIICIFLAVLSLMFEYKSAIVGLCVMFLVAGMAGRLKEFAEMWAKTILILTIVIFVMQAFLLPGETVLWKFWILSVKLEGVQKGISLCSRLVAIASAMVLAIKIIDAKKLTIALEQRGVKPSATYVITSTINIIPQMSKKMHVILDAQRSRGIETESNVWVRAKAFFPIIGPLILNSIMSVEERCITLEARGFSASAKKTRLYSVQDTEKDKIVRKLCLAGMLIMIVGRIILCIVWK